MPAIEIENVSKKYYYLERRKQDGLSLLGLKRYTRKEFWALDDISLEIPEGDTLGFIGLNGAGKSTLLKIIAGIAKPDRGTVKVSGRIGALLELGIGFHPELNGYENIFLNGSMLGIPHEEIRANLGKIVEFSGIGDYLEMPVKYFSSGMQMRLGFAIVASINPDIILIDEVFAVGDVEFQAKCIEKLKEFLEAGKTIIVVSHQLYTLQAICNKLAWLDDGSMVMIGASSEVGKAYSKKTYQKLLADQLSFSVDYHSSALEKVQHKGIARIEARLRDAKGSKVSCAHTGEQYHCEIVMTCDTKLLHPLIHLLLTREDGVLVSEWYIDDLVATEVREGKLFLKATFEPLLLLQGDYSLSIRIVNAQHQNTIYYSQMDFYTFEVVTEEFPYEKGLFVSEIPCSWSLK